METEHGAGDIFRPLLDRQLEKSSLDKNQAGLLDADFYRSYGRKYARDWAIKDTGTTRLNQMLSHGYVYGAGSDGPTQILGEQTLGDIKGLQNVTGCRIESGGVPSQYHDIDPSAVPWNDVSIRVDLQFILCDLELANELQDYKLAAASLEPLAKELGTTVLITGRDTREQGYDNPSTLQEMHAFNIHDDEAILTEISSSRGVVVGTPTLRNGRWISAISEVARILQSSFKMAFNASTGLHVHIAIGREYSLEDLKRISKAIVLFEEQMNTHHPRSRNPKSPTKWLYVYSQILPCSASGPLAGHSKIGMMKKIDGAQSVLELIAMVNCDNLVYCGKPHRRYRYNLASVPRTSAIEFRQALGTNEPHRILEWIKRVIKFVTSAVATPDLEFAGWAVKGIQDPGVYYRFGVPPPPVKGLWLRIRIYAPKRQVRFVANLKNTVWRKRGRSSWLFEQSSAGKRGFVKW